MVKRKIVGVRVPAPELYELIWRVRFAHRGEEYQFSVAHDDLILLPSGKYTPKPGAYIVYPEKLTPEKPPLRLEISPEVLREVKRKIKSRRQR